MVAHITGIMLIEIIFYFTYIGPTETELFISMINSALKKSFRELYASDLGDDTIVGLILHHNSTDEHRIFDQLDVTETYLMDKSDNSRHDRNTENDKLCLNAFGVIILVGVFTTILYCICRRQYEIVLLYNKHTPSISAFDSFNSVSSVELANMSAAIDNSDVEMAQTNQQDVSDVVESNTDMTRTVSRNITRRNGQSEIKYDGDKTRQSRTDFYRNVLSSVAFYFMVGGALMLAEYIFFRTIVMNYIVLSRDELVYLIFKKIKSDAELYVAS